MPAWPRPSEQERLELKAIGRITSIKSSDTEVAYLDECRRLCRLSGLEHHGVRAIVWKDMTLGFSTMKSVPLLAGFTGEDNSVIVQPYHVMDSENGQNSGGVIVSSPPCGCSSTEGCIADVSSSLAASSSSTSSHREVIHTDQVASIAPGAPSEWKEEVVTASSGSTTRRIVYRLPENCHPRVVQVDIERSLWTLYPEATKRNSMRARLHDIIIRILASNGECNYYQGLHELMGFVMYVMEPYVAFDVIATVCQNLLITRWRSFSAKTLNQSEAMLYAMHAILAEENATLAMQLESCGVAPESHYAVSWLITWFVHNVDNAALLGRLFDYFISEPDEWGVVLFIAALLLTNGERILGWVEAAKKAEGGNESSDLLIMAEVYAKLTTIPKEVLSHMPMNDINAVVAHAIVLRRKHIHLVAYERRNFLEGNIRKLGLLANERTRNPALRLIWRWLPREWRYPAQGRRAHISPLLFAAFAAVTTAAMVLRVRGKSSIL